MDNEKTIEPKDKMTSEAYDKWIAMGVEHGNVLSTLVDVEYAGEVRDD